VLVEQTGLLGCCAILLGKFFPDWRYCLCIRVMSQFMDSQSCRWRWYTLLKGQTTQKPWRHGSFIRILVCN